MYARGFFANRVSFADFLLVYGVVTICYAVHIGAELEKMKVRKNHSVEHPGKLFLDFFLIYPVFPVFFVPNMEFFLTHGISNINRFYFFVQ